jgi:hypothetical protein
MQSTPTTVLGPHNQTSIRIRDVKKEIVAECHAMFEHLHDEFGHIQSALEKQQQKKGQTLQSIQNECAISHAGLTSRVDRIEDERDILWGDLMLLKNDVNGESIGEASSCHVLTVFS